MRVLLIAYEFSPSPSPQSLRWAYLGRELSELGHEVHVLTPEALHEAEGLPTTPASMTLHRVSGGAAARLQSVLVPPRRIPRSRSRGVSLTTREAKDVPLAGLPIEVAEVIRASRLNWKGQLMGRLKAAVSWVMFPDERAGWFRAAKTAGLRLVDEIQPDAVLASHEPATSIEVGMAVAQAAGLPLVLDLGDPILAGYTPKRWRARAHALEARAMGQADGVIVTSDATRELLLARHAAIVAGKQHVRVITQGFDDRRRHGAGELGGLFDPARLELLYTGSFYRFRRPQALIEAVTSVPGVRLNIATSVIPEWLVPSLRGAASQIRLLGFLPHTTVLDVQTAADVLINIANDDPCQVPGKLYEYLGAGRPILHLCDAPEGDACAELVRARRRGWVSSNEAGAIASALEKIRDAKRGRDAFRGCSLSPEDVAEFAWSALARDVVDVLERAVEARRGLARADARR